MYRIALMSRTILTTFAATMFLLADAGPALAAADVDPLFASSETLDAEIEAPFGMLSRERPDEEEAPGTFRYRDTDGNLVEFDIAIRTRGRLRRGKEICNFPPFRLNFKKSQVDDTLFDKQDKLKLVSHCKHNSNPYEQSLIAEYLAYRIFNLLSDKSFHARLLRVTYIFSDKNRDAQGFAILIEHKDRLEKRLDAKTISTQRVKVETIEPEDLNLTSVFHYFIGNTDFSPIASAPNEDCCHNQVLFTREGQPSLTVPYDFDQSGLVDSPYSQPNPRFKLRNVRDRLYRGRCDNNEYLPATLDLFRSKRSEIEALINNQEGLSGKTQRSMLDFVGQFYRTIDDPRRLEREITKRCIN